MFEFSLSVEVVHTLAVSDSNPETSEDLIKKVDINDYDPNFKY